MERRVEEIEAESPTAGGGDSRELALLRDDHLARLDDLRDYGRYNEVPKPLRDEEISRTRAFIGRVEALLVEAGDKPDRAADQAGLSAQLAEAQTAKDDADRTYDALRDEERRHGIDLDVPGSPWSRLSREEVVGFVFDGDEAWRYREVQALKVEGERHRREGTRALAAARESLRKQMIGEALHRIRLGRTAFDLAAPRFAAAAVLLSEIEDDNPGETWR